jgi:ATP-binding cassette subfamily B protein
MMPWFGGGPTTISSSRDAGLPPAGVPGDLAERVQAVMGREPQHPEPPVAFSHRVPPGPRFGLRTFLGPHRGRLAVAAVLVIAETALLQLGPLLTQLGIDHGVVDRNGSFLAVVGVAYLAAIVAGALAGRSRVLLTGRLGEDLMFDLRIRVFSHLQRQSVDFYTNEKAGVLMTRMTSDIESLSNLFQEGLVNLAVQGLTLVVIVTILVVLDPTLAAVTLLVVVPATLGVSEWFRRRSNRAYDTIRDRIAGILSDLSESLAGIRLIAAHNRRDHNVARHRRHLEAHRAANLEAARATAIYAPSADAIGVLSQAVVALVGGRMVLDANLSIGELSAFLLYVNAFFAPIAALTQLYNGYQQGQASIRKLAELLATEPGVPEAPAAVELPPLTGEIRLEGVAFAYVAGTEVLTDVDLVVAPGETLAVVGPTGAGKSTIARLVCRFADPTAGVVRIDGYDLRTVTITSLRRQLGVVPQEPFLFAGTLRDNLIFARPEATDTEVDAAVSAVGLDALVATLPDGVDTYLHERGSSLSAGERQLLALARAFLAQPRVLVLDEATSNLDLVAEARIEAALDAVLEGRTAIVVAHRLATARRADRIVVVDGGRIVETGTHAELVARGGCYHALNLAWERAGAAGAVHDHD